MDVQILFKSLVFLFLLLVCPQIIEGFATTHCENKQLGGQIKEFLQCSLNNLDEHADEVIDIAKQLIQNSSSIRIDGNADMCLLTQKVIRGEIICAKSLAETCFEQQISGLVSDAVSVFEGGCTDPYAPVNQQKVKSFKKKLEGVKGQQELEDYLMSKITFDKPCSLKDRGDEMYKGPMTCLIRDTADMAKKLDSGRPTGEPNVMAFGLVQCNTIVPILTSCFTPNKCFSEHEMSLVRDTALTMYDAEMKFVAKYLPRFKEILQAKVPKVLEHLNEMIKDYQTGSCKTKIKSSPAALLSSARNQLLSKFLAITVSVFSIMMI